MKRLSLLGFASVMAALLAGCPIYEDHGGAPPPCTGESCDPGGPNPTTCTSSEECGLNETCGQDGECHSGDCTIWGCSEGFECTIHEDLTASCQTPTNPGTVYCGNPDDCSSDQTCAPDGTCHAGACDQDIGGGTTLGCIFGFVCTEDGSWSCLPQNPAACGADPDCASFGAGYQCVSGICTAPADQCFDQTQCPSGNKCVEGKCTPSCAADPDCPAGYSCSPALNLCTIPSAPCLITNDCGGPDRVCVDGTCVPRSVDGMCEAGGVWVENGCISNQSASFICAIDGEAGSGAGEPGVRCADGSVCLHHSCYISCDPPNGTACDGLPSFNQCKSVTTGSGTHQVCGSDQNLGGECGIELQLECVAGQICVDGYCN